MKRIQRTAALLLALLMILAACSTAALAATDYKVLLMKKGTWVKLPKGDTDKIYKLVLYSDSIVTVKWLGNKNNHGRAFLYPDKDCYNYIETLIGNEASGTYSFALGKGTYYIRMYEYADTPTTKIRVTIEKAINKANYCRAKAIALKPGVTVKIAQTPDNSYDRWYKIELNRRKTVTITINDGRNAKYIYLYDSKMNVVKHTRDDHKVITEDPLAKGTYFIWVMGGFRYSVSYPEYRGDYITIKWN